MGTIIPNKKPEKVMKKPKGDTRKLPEFKKKPPFCK